MAEARSARETANRAWRVILQVLLVIAAIALALAIPTLYIAAQGASRAARNAIADACAAELSTIPPSDLGAIDTTRQRLRVRYNLLEIQIVGAPGPRGEADVMYRALPSGSLRIRFHEQRPLAPAAMRTALLVGVIAATISAGLLLFNLMASFRPAPAPVESDGEEGYLFKTFQSSIKDLKSRATELERVSEQERARANELAVVSATLVRSLSSGFVAIDERGLIVDVNSTARELLGIAADLRVHGRDVTSALGRREFAAALLEAIQHRRPLQRVEIAEEGGSIFGLTTVPLVDDRGRYLGMLALFTDLAPIRRLETRVREMHALAELGEISAGIAHEFRNSLSTVLGYLRLASKGDVSPETLQRLQGAEKEAKQLNAAVESLLSYARPMRLQFSALSLRALLTELIERVRTFAPDISITLHGDDAQVRADAPLLARAFENVLRNAVEAIQERGGRGTIRVSIEAGRGPSVTIADDGIGLRGEDPTRLFLPFQSSKTMGTGLGLALAKKIVILHGGVIRLEGRAGGGAIVRVDFPSGEAAELDAGT